MPDIFVATPKTTTAQTQDSIAEEVNEPNPEYLDEDINKQNNSVHLFTSFCKYPGGVSFQNQDQGEKILLFIRRAFITNIKWFIFGLFLILVPIIFIIPNGVATSPLSFLPWRYNLLFLIFYYLLVSTYLYINFITWYFNISLVTNRRIFDVDYTGLVFKDVAATKISLVQDVSYMQIGVARNFFDYGDVLVQTAGTLENFRFESAPQPEKIVHVIEALIGKRYVQP
jgi:hypothetical protein